MLAFLLKGDLGGLGSKTVDEAGEGDRIGCKVQAGGCNPLSWLKNPGVSHGAIALSKGRVNAGSGRSLLASSLIVLFKNSSVITGLSDEVAIACVTSGVIVT